jgi:pimeloyl-ACP methyl ester carboxylesterase
MRKIVAVAIAIVLCLTLSVIAQPSVEGTWLGTLTVQGVKLRLALKVSCTGEGALTAKLDSIDQGATDLPVDEIVLEGEVLRFTARRLGLTYSGTLHPTGKIIRGEMKQGGAVLPLTFERVDSLPSLSRRQDPVKPYPYSEEDVRYRNVKDGVELAGTLTLPAGEGPHPAVVLITGSGAQDRDETIAGHRPFLVLADYLTRRGIAVLRSDDRGVGGSSAGSAYDTTETFAGDTLAAVTLLRARDDIDRRRIGLLGHSEGSVIAAIAATRSRDIAYVVMLAGMGQTGEEVIVAQTKVMQQKLGVSAPVVDATRTALRRVFAVLRSEPDAAAVQRMQQVLDEQAAAVPQPARQEFEAVRKNLAAQLRMYTTAWFRFFIDYDPALHLRTLTVPLLALTGELDLQAPPGENLPRIEKAVRRGANRRVTVRELPGLNHLLQTASTGLPAEYAAIDETIAPQALEQVAAWIEKQR